MVISVITLFPQVFKPILGSSIIAKAQEQRKLKIELVNLRKFGIGKRKQVDDRVYGGGVGMILRVEPIVKAIQKATSGKRGKIILLTPRGKKFDQACAFRLAKEKHITLICGKYEGVDERVRKSINEELSIGDYILSGGEIGAMVIIDAVSRLLPGVLDKEATQNESFTERTVGSKRALLLEPPQYTRPEEFNKIRVPRLLLSGNHQKIAEWRLNEAIKKTRRMRPDLIG